MTEILLTEIQSIVRPLLAGLGFLLDGVDGNVNESGGRNSVVYYRPNESKIQVYQSPREGGVNCVI
jgi:hypothetical protein